MPKLLEIRHHPLCGIHLEGFVLRLPFLESIFMLIGSGFLILGSVTKWEEWRNHRTENPALHYLRLMLWIGYAIHIVSTLGLAVLLRKAALSKNAALIRVWIVGTLISVLFALGVMYTNMFVFSQFLPHVLTIVTGYGILKFYIAYAVYFYLREMETDIAMASALRPLTDLEIEEFEKGQPIPALGLFDPETKNLVDRVQYQRYKREDFEIPKERFEIINFDAPLGKGEYGTVYKAKLKSPKKVADEEDQDEGSLVAIKTIDPSTADVMCFKALLSELKVMTYMGSHKNVIQLIGANTEQIRQRNFLLIIEFCALGNMLNFLRGSRGLFRNLVHDNGQVRHISTKNINYDCPIPDSTTTLDLVRWAHEIAEGMEYLASKKVIHGDLATRNILLTDKKTVKITDFGLARQLYQYSVYIRKPNALVPWRWLALESLVDMNFSIHSDVWAYGITLWEIFSLGEVPFPGHDFSLRFIDNLKSGLRPTLSPNTPTFISDLMQQCWKAEPKARPTFTQICRAIHSDECTFNKELTTSL